MSSVNRPHRAPEQLPADPDPAVADDGGPYAKPVSPTAASSTPAGLGVLSLRLRAIVRGLADFKVGHLVSDYRRRYPEGDPRDLGGFGGVTGGRFARRVADGDITEAEAARGLLRGLLTKVQQAIEVARSLPHGPAEGVLAVLCGVEHRLCSAGRGPGGIVERVRRVYQQATSDYARDLGQWADRMDAARYRGDVCPPAPGVPPEPPTRSGGGGDERVRFDDHTLTVTVDGARFQNLPPDAYKFVRAVAEANPNVVTSRELHEEPGLKGKRFNKLRTALPPKLGNCIASKPGCGYWLTLPENSA
jgi:hypothetical protein